MDGYEPADLPLNYHSLPLLLSQKFCFKLMFFHQFTRNVSIEKKFTVSMPIFACENSVKVLQFPCDAGLFAR